MILLVAEKECEEVCRNCSQDWLGNNEQRKAAMEPSPTTKELQHKWVQENFMFSQCERGGYLGGWGVSTCVYC